MLEIVISLVRHAESVANAGAVTSDYAGIPLTDRGRRQAEWLATTFEDEPTWLACSAFLRAQETAAPLQRRYPGCVMTTVPVHEFTYLAPADCEDMNAKAREPLVTAYWQRMDPSFCDGDGAESFAAFVGRGARFLVDVARRPAGGVVFTHEQFIRLVLLLVLAPHETSASKLMRRFYALRSALPIANCTTVRLRLETGRWWVTGPSAAPPTT